MIKWKCKYCAIYIDLLNKNSKSSHLSKCNNWIEWKEINLTKDFLYNKYIIENKSLPEIAKELNLDNHYIISKYLKKFNIPLRTISKAYSLSNKKREASCINKYGAKHIFCKESKVKLDIKNKLINNHGVENVFQLNYVKEKIKKTNLSKYGVENPGSNIDVRKKMNDTIKEKYGVDSPLLLVNRNTGKIFSKIHKKVYDFLIKSGFSAKNEKYLRLNNNDYFFDIYFEEHPFKFIEINGDYYHAFPGKYKENDYIKVCKKYAKDIWNKDLRKLNDAINNNYNVLVLWEHEINKNFNEVERKIFWFLNENNKN